MPADGDDRTRVQGGEIVNIRRQHEARNALTDRVEQSGRVASRGERAVAGKGRPASRIDAEGAVEVWAIPVDESVIMAQDAFELLRSK